MAADPLFEIVKVMLPLSLASFGGGATIIVGLETIAVRQLYWVTPADFVTLFAVSRVAPGPGTTVCTLIGWQLAGLPGELVSSAAIYLPTSLLAYCLFRFSHARRDRPWNAIVRRALAPVGTGLIFTAVWALFRAAAADWAGVAIASASFGILQVAPNLSAILVLVAGAVTMIGYQMLS